MNSNIQFFCCGIQVHCLQTDSFVILVYISMYQVWCVPFTELHKHAYSYCFTIAHLK